MKLSPLQIARYQYTPKLPGMLRNGISEICVKNGDATQSVADQEKIAVQFPNTYGKNEITFQKGQNTAEAKKQVVGVILSGGQAPGGHNVVCGLYDALKAGDLTEYLAEYRRDCVNLGRTVQLISPAGRETVTAVGVDPEFGLVVRRADGAEKTVRSGEVSVRGMYGYVE